MKKSKVKRQKKSLSPPHEGKSKVFRSRSKSTEREKKNENKGPRKTRWETHESHTAETFDKSVTGEKQGTEDLRHDAPLRIRDLVDDDKEKIVEYLFRTVTGTALEELIPDYLKKRSVEELKKLCLHQLQAMSRDCILNIISETKSGKVNEEDFKPSNEKSSSVVPSPALSTSSSGDFLEICPSASEIKSILPEEENQATALVKEDVGNPIPENDPDLLELEMRARAIRSLLKAKSQEMSDAEARCPSPDE